jgi:hypothetical protein
MSAIASRRVKSSRLSIETLEDRCLLSSSPLTVSGNHLIDPTGHTVRLTGVNNPSLEWSNTGGNVLQSRSGRYANLQLRPYRHADPSDCERSVNKSGLWFYRSGTAWVPFTVYFLKASRQAGSIRQPNSPWR